LHGRLGLRGGAQPSLDPIHRGGQERAHLECQLGLVRPSEISRGQLLDQRVELDHWRIHGPQVVGPGNGAVARIAHEH
jgi:hypothetical protein